MIRSYACGLSAVLSLFAVGSFSFADSDWPHWRGPTGNGVSPDARPPTKWSGEEGISWKVKIPGRGSASPIIWKDKIFIATAIAAATADKPNTDDGDAGRGQQDRRGRGRRGGGRGRGRGRGGRGGGSTATQKFTLLCLDKKTGKTLWEAVSVEEKPHQGHHPDHGFASASPITNGEHVYTHFGSRGLFCYDMKGKLVWKKTDFGKMETRGAFGEGSSPALYGNTIIVPWDHEGPSYIAALDAKTGKELWKIKRDEPSSWASPIVIEHAGRAQVIASGQNFARGYDLESGKELWRCAGQTSRPVASPVVGHGLAFIGSGYRGNYLGAFKLDGKGDLEGSDAVAWQISRGAPDVPSLLLSGKRLYFHSGRSGMISCYDATSGKAHYSQERVEGLKNVYASPVGAAGKIYLTARDGTTAIIEDADSFKLLALNKLGENVDATPALVGNQIFIRGSEHLYCIGE